MRTSSIVRSFIFTIRRNGVRLDISSSSFSHYPFSSSSSTSFSILLDSGFSHCIMQFSVNVQMELFFCLPFWLQIMTTTIMKIDAHIARKISERKSKRETPKVASKYHYRYGLMRYASRRHSVACV